MDVGGGQCGGVEQPKASPSKSGQQKRNPKPRFAQETHVTPLSGSTIRPLPIIKSHLPSLSLTRISFGVTKPAALTSLISMLEFRGPPQTKT